MLQSAALRKIFEPTRDETRRGWRRMHKKNCDLCFSPNIIGVIESIRMRCVGHVACMERRGAKRVLVEGPHGKRPLGRPRHSWENNKIDLQDVG